MLIESNFVLFDLRSQYFSDRFLGALFALLSVRWVAGRLSVLFGDFTWRPTLLRGYMTARIPII
ncbi:MAG: hypothetical protein ACRC62_11965 [Microcoleus sp.]